MELKFFLDSKLIKNDITISNHRIVKDMITVERLEYYGVNLKRPLKFLLGYPSESKFGITGFKKSASCSFKKCLISTRTNKYIEVKEVFLIGDIFLFKYNNEWYVARRGGGLITRESLTEYSKKTFNEEDVVESEYSQYLLDDTEDITMYIHNDHRILKGFKNVKLYPRYQVLNTLDIKNKGISYKVKELSTYYKGIDTDSYYHKSLDGITPFSFTTLFTKEELRKVKLGNHICLFTEKTVNLLGINLGSTFFYRQGFSRDKVIFNDTSKKYSLLDTGTYTCMDFVKENSNVDYFISKFYTELFDYKEDDVVTWYKHILELFKGVYTEKDMQLKLVEISGESTPLCKNDGLNLHYWHIELSSNVSAYHKYLFAILFRYCYSSYQYSFPIKIMDLIDGGQDVWTAIKTVLNSGIKETNWDISEEANQIHMDLSFETYLERLKTYDRKHKFTSLSLLK